MKKVFTTLILVASIGVLPSIVVAPSVSHAMFGCTRDIRPTNPDDAGYVNCLSAAMRGCVSQCHAINHCYNANNPPSTVGCQQQLNAYNQCRQEQALVIPPDNGGGVASTTRTLAMTKRSGSRKVSWSSQSGCYMAGGATIFSGTASLESLNDSGAVSAAMTSAVDSSLQDKCEQVVASTIGTYYNVDASSLTANLDLRNDLGATESELNEIAARLGSQFGVTISTDVVANLHTMGDVVRCIGTAAVG